MSCPHSNIRFFRENGKERVEIAPKFNPTLIVCKDATEEDKGQWLEEYIHFKKSEIKMTTQVKKVCDVVAGLESLNQKADHVSALLEARIVEADTALDMTKALSDTLGDVTAKLRSTLGVQTNSPPVDPPLAVPAE